MTAGTHPTSPLSSEMCVLQWPENIPHPVEPKKEGVGVSYPYVGDMVSIRAGG